MAEKRGCFKTGCLGCLGLIVIGTVFTGVTALVAWRGADDKEIVDREILAPFEVGNSSQESPAAEPTPAEIGEGPSSGKGGKLVLDLSQGSFYLHPAPAGEGLTIKANFDEDIFNLEDKFETLPDSTWVYQVRFYRTISGLQAILRQMMGGGHNNSIHFYIPADVPIELVVKTTQGGFEAELGGLWLTSADIGYSQGGFELDFKEPLVEPIESLMIHGKMGGFEASNIGNASPQIFGVRCLMGGAEVDMSGQWLNDCSARFSVKMGGMAVIVPDDVAVRGSDGDDDVRLDRQSEVPLPVLTISTSQSMGEIEVIR